MIPLRFLLAPALAVAVSACSASVASSTLELHAGGMTCSNCERALTDAVLTVPGVEACTAEHASGRVVVTFDPSRTNAARIADAIRRIGYDVP